MLSRGQATGPRAFAAFLAAAIFSLTPPARAENWDMASVDQFQSPSGKILCTAWTDDTSTGVTCEQLGGGGDAGEPKPDDCEFDWGGSFTVLASSKRGEVDCRIDFGGDPKSPVLQYGESIDAHGVKCTSRRSGMTCVNADGHGFFVSRDSQKVF